MLTRLGWSAAVLLCFGLLGLIFLLPHIRRRARERTARCATCRRHGKIGRIALVALLALLCVGAGVRVSAALAPPVVCHSHVTASGQIQPEPYLPLAASAPPFWATTRRAVVAPISGVALLASRAAGMRLCWGPPLLVTFWWPPRAGGGSTVGDTFVTWIPSWPGQSGSGDHPSNPYAYGIGAESYVRFGPAISSSRADEERLGRHETRHLDQWTVFTLIGGPLAFPVAYYADSAFFPGPRNHFERAAGLSDGSYPVPDDYGPDPIWWLVATVGGVLLVVFRTRLRLLARVLAGGRAHWRRSHPQRCPRHSTGWFRRR